MTTALSFGHWTSVLWRGVASTNTRCVLSIGMLFGALLAAGLYRHFEPLQHASITPAPPVAGIAAADPVARFQETRIGHVLYSPYTGDNCRRVFFDNRTGAFYEAGDIPCVQSAAETEPAGSGGPVQGADRMQAMRKHFQK